MKKTIVNSLLILMAFPISLFSQNARFGITAGITFANMHSKVDGQTDNGSYKPGFTAGILADLSVADHISIQPAVNFTQKGAKESSGGVTTKANLNYLEIPVNVLYNSKGAEHNFFFGAGPSIAFGLSGKFKVKSGGQEYSEKVKFGNGTNDDLKGFDFGANFVAGVELKKMILIALNFNQTLNNLATSESGGTLKNNYFGLRVGYLLGGSGK